MSRGDPGSAPHLDRNEQEIDPHLSRRESGIDAHLDRNEQEIDPHLDRSDQGIDPHLDLKIGLFFLAAVLGLAGIFLGRTLPIFAAMVVIGAGLLLRFVRRRNGSGERPAGPSDRIGAVNRESGVDGSDTRAETSDE